MKFTINRVSFINELNNVLRAISSKTTIPILTGIKMVVEDNQIVLTTPILPFKLRLQLMMVKQP